MTTAPSFKAEVSLWKWRGKIVRARAGGMTKGNRVFKTRQSSCTYKFTVIVIVTTCTRSVQGQAMVSMEMGGRHDVYP